MYQRATRAKLSDNQRNWVKAQIESNLQRYGKIRAKDIVEQLKNEHGVEVKKSAVYWYVSIKDKVIRNGNCVVFMRENRQSNDIHLRRLALIDECLALAVTDAKGKTVSKEYSKEESQGRAKKFIRSSVFEYWCELLGVDPDQKRQQIKQQGVEL